MGYGSLFVPVHLVPFSLQPHTLLSRLSSFSCLHLFVHDARTYGVSPLESQGSRWIGLLTFVGVDSF